MICFTTSQIQFYWCVQTKEFSTVYCVKIVVAIMFLPVFFYCIENYLLYSRPIGGRIRLTNKRTLEAYLEVAVKCGMRANLLVFYLS